MTEMTERLPVELPKAYRLLNHGPTVLVGSAHDGRRNVMAAAWNMPLDFSPPKVAVVIDRNTLTRELVEASGEFSLNVPARIIARETLAVGSVSGRDTDKFTDGTGVHAFEGSHIQAPSSGVVSPGWNAASSPSRTIRIATISFSARSLRPGPIRVRFAMGTGSSRPARRAVFTTSPAATSSRPVKPSKSNHDPQRSDTGVRRQHTCRP